MSSLAVRSAQKFLLLLLETNCELGPQNHYKNSAKLRLGSSVPKQPNPEIFWASSDHPELPKIVQISWLPRSTSHPENCCNSAPSPPSYGWKISWRISPEIESEIPATLQHKSSSNSALQFHPEITPAQDLEETILALKGSAISSSAIFQDDSSFLKEIPCKFLKCSSPEISSS